MHPPQAIDTEDRKTAVELRCQPKCSTQRGLHAGDLATSSGTITARLRALLADDPDRVVFRFVQAGREVPIDYATLVDRAARYASFLRRAGVVPGDVVPIVLQHDEHLLYAFFGAMLIGARPAILAYPTPKLDPHRWAQAAAKLLANTAARLLITYDELAERLRVAARGTHVAVKPDLTECEPLTEPHWHVALPDEPAFLQFSSGTTGLQKGLALAHRAVIAQIEDYSAAMRLSGGDRIMSWLPLYHDMGLIACMLLSALTATPCVWLSPFEWVKQPRLLLEAATRHAATLCWLPNFAFSFMARAISAADLDGLDLSSVRCWVNCSEPIRADSFEAFAARFAPAGVRRESLGTCYAMAENTFAVTQSVPGAGFHVDYIDAERLQRGQVAVPVEPGHPRVRRQVSSGRCIDGVGVQIRATDGRVLGDRRVGRIFVRGRSQFGGYWPDTTSLLNDYYDTGDLGYLADGELYVTGRVKDLIICRGRNIYPQDVEALADGFPEIIPGRIVALGVDDALLGTEDILLLAETESAEAETSGAALREHLLRSLDLPSLRVRLVDPGWLIKTSSGKIARAANRDKHLRQPEQTLLDAPRPQSATGDAIPERLLAYVRRSARSRAAETVGAHTRIDEVLDSLATVELFAFVESAFGVRCGQQALDIAARGTIGELSRFIAAERSRPRCAERVLELAAGGDDALAGICADETLQARFERKFSGSRLNVSVFFRRRIDCMIADVRELARRGVKPGDHWWSADLQRVLGADVVLLDYFAEMLCTPEVRLLRPGDPRVNPARECTAMRWVPVSGSVDVDELFVEQTRLLTPRELAACYDELVGLIRGRLVVLTYGEDCARTYAWYPWLREVNATLRRRAKSSAWQLCDTGRALDALPRRHYRAPFAGLPDEHRDRARALLAEFFEKTSFIAAATHGQAVRGVTGRRRAAHSCTRFVSTERLERWSKWYRRVAIVGEEFSCRGLQGGLEQRGVEGRRFRRPEDVSRDCWQAVIIVSGRYQRAALDALAAAHGQVPIESPLTQGVTLTDQEQLFRHLLVELWQRLAAQGKSVGLYGAGTFARYFLRVVAEADSPRIAWLVDDDPRKHEQILFGHEVLTAEHKLPAVDTVLVLSERDKDFQRRTLERFESSSEVICPAAYSATIPAPKCWTFAARAQETFLNPERRPIPSGRWDA